MFYPSGYCPDEARIEMSGLILSAEGREGEPGSSSRQLDFKPQDLIQSHFCLSPYIFHFCSSLHHPTKNSPLFFASLELSNFNTWFLLSFHVSPRLIKCPSLDRRGTEYGTDLRRSQSSLPSDETLNLPFASFCPFLSSSSAKSTSLALEPMSHNYPHFSQIIHIFTAWFLLKMPFLCHFAESLLDSKGKLSRSD